MTKTEVVANVKQALVARGVNLTGPCGAFEITKRVAWALRDEGFGLVAKNPGQNGCDANGARFAIDAIMLRDGQTFDILVSAGGEERNGIPMPGTGNGPAFQVTGAAPRESWRAPFDPDPRPGPDPDPGPDPSPDLQRILAAQAAAIERIHAAIATLQQAVAALAQRQP